MMQKLFHYASPQTFYPLAGKLWPLFAILGAGLTAWGLWLGMFVAPTDFQQGEGYRIIFVHVPVSWMSMVIYLAMAFWAFLGFTFNTRLSGMMTQALAPTGALFTFLSLWTGATAQTSPRSPVATFRIADRGALWRLAVDPAVQFGELYTAGRITLESGDLVAGLREILAANPPGAPLPLAARVARYLAAVRPKAQALAREQAQAHYDLGNDFYRLWLDPLQIYSCAYYAQAGMTLAQAQIGRAHV